MNDPYWECPNCGFENFGDTCVNCGCPCPEDNKMTEVKKTQILVDRIEAIAKKLRKMEDEFSIGIKDEDDEELSED